ncbi:MAG: glycine zipper 2TM domain-containing protein [Candidatus Pseudothioglobus sp.]
MKIILKSIVVISFFITSQLAFAGSFVDSATVTSVEKVYKQYRVDEPYQDCYIKETLQTGDGSATNEIMGAILGGAIGNQFGEGSGKDVMTLAGIFLGASIANDAEKANSTGQVIVSQEVCENKVRQKIVKRLSHYKINVDYNGHNVSYTSNRRPYDDVVKVEVTISSLND